MRHLRWLGLLLGLDACLPVNRAFRNAPAGVPVYVVSNGFHTDLLLPLHAPDGAGAWLNFLQNPDWATRFAAYQYVAFGWGNADFYLAYRGGQRPGVLTTVRAVLPARTVLHVDFYRQAPRRGRHVAALRLTQAQYQELTEYVQAAFARDSAGGLRPYAGFGFTPDDFFFAAQGRYHLLHTCNSWTNDGLRRAGVRAARLPLLAPQVMRQVRKINE